MVRPFLTGQRYRELRFGSLLIIALSLGAWLLLWLWSRSPDRPGVGHHGLDVAIGGIGPAVSFILGWGVMVIAMMLPTTLPLLTAVLRRGTSGYTALLVAGYVVSWIGFGGVIYGGAWVFQRLPGMNAWLNSWRWALPAVTVLIAGTYQLTRSKRTSLDACRTPLVCVPADGPHKMGDTLLTGMQAGLCSIGCCWALMLLMFTNGAVGIGGMLGLGAVMLAETVSPWGRRLVAPIGMVLLIWGVVVLLSGGAVPSHTHHH